MRSPSNTTRASVSPRAIAQNLHSPDATGAHPIGQSSRDRKERPARASNVILCAPSSRSRPWQPLSWPAPFRPRRRRLRLPGLIQGTAASERLTVVAAGTRVLGMEGDDRITGGAGRDCLEGGPGKDLLSGRGGRDVLLGGPGRTALPAGAAPTA